MFYAHAYPHTGYTVDSTDLVHTPAIVIASVGLVVLIAGASLGSGFVFVTGALVALAAAVYANVTAIRALASQPHPTPVDSERTPEYV